MLRWARTQQDALPEIPRPWDVREFAARVALQRGRRIELIPRTMSRYASVATGLWVRRPEMDQIVYDTSGTELHQSHVILHELSHMLCNHEGIAFDRGAVAQRAFAGGPGMPPGTDGVLESLPDPVLDAGRLGVRVSHRAAYDDAQELQAETLAFVIWQAADLRLISMGDSDTARLFGAFEHHRGGGTEQ
jgi:hypothetical protein